MSTTVKTPLAKYPRINQTYTIDLDGTTTEVFKLGSSTQAIDGATIYTILTSTNKTHEFAIEKHVTQVDPEIAREMRKQMNELFKLYRKHEIGIEQYTTALAEISA